MVRKPHPRSNIEATLQEAVAHIPSQEMLDLQETATKVIAELGSPVSMGQEDQTFVDTPDLCVTEIGGKDFDLRLRQITHADKTDAREAFSEIQLLAKGIDGNDIVCASLENGNVSVMADDQLPRLNDEADIQLFSKVVEAGWTKVSEKRLKEAQAATNRRRLTRRALLFGGIGLGAVVVVGGGIWGIAEMMKNVDTSEWGLSDAERFDRKGYTLAGGAELTLGQTVIPEFSQELATNPNLAGSLIPILTNVQHGNDYRPDDRLSPKDGLRQIIIPNGLHREKPGGSEIPWTYMVPLSSLPDSTKFKVWTDLRSANGTSRANELRLSYQKDQLVFQWQGYRINGEQARIVVQIEQ